jgi:hypothetical protein
MQNVFNKYGRFDTSVLEEISDETDRLKAEQVWLDVHYGSPGCLNLSPSADRGSTRGIKRSPETKARISASLMGGVRSPETKARLKEASRKRWDANPASEETRRKMSIASIGRKHTESSKSKMSEIASERGGLGPKKHSEQTRAKMREAHKDRFTPEFRLKISEAQKLRALKEKQNGGRITKPKSEETLQKLSSSLKIKFSDETVLCKMREAQKARRARERLARENSCTSF